MKKLHLSSSLILAACSPRAKSPTILALRRSSKMKAFPRALVFPGGHTDVADEHLEWLTILPSSEQNVNLKILKPKHIVNSNQISNAISSRIAAIRETFEECGILLCRRNDTSETVLLSPSDEHYWRRKVHENAHEFRNLCRAYHCFPDLKALYLISNWITPFHFPKRFNTTFFLSIINQEIAVTADDSETESVEWKTAEELLENTDVFMAPPQIYELTKIKNFNNLTTFKQFADNVDSVGCQQFIPVMVNTQDGEVTLLPGDGRYEEFFLENAEKVVRLDCDTINFRGDVMNRVECRKLPNSTFQRNAIIQNAPIHSLKL